MVFVSIATIIFVIVVRLLFNAIKKVESGTSGLVNKISTSLQNLEQKADDLEASLSPITDIQANRISPITQMTFVQSLNHKNFVEAIQMSVYENLKSAVLNEFADIGNITVQSLEMADGKTKMVFELSQKGQVLIEKGEAVWSRNKSGKILATIRNAKTGRIIEQAKEAPKILSKMANLTTVVVSAAHVISGYDVVKRLKSIEKHIDFLVAARKIDQLARLESIYGFASEILSRSLDREGKYELWTMRRDVMELRSAWRRELIYNLNRIEDPANASWFKQFFTRSTIDKDIADKVSGGEVELGLIEYSLKLDLALSESSGTLDTFLSKTLLAEIDSLKAVHELIAKKASYISDKYPESTPEDVVGSMERIIKAYAELCNNEMPIINSQSDAKMLGKGAA
jgi:hypothetical protein